MNRSRPVVLTKRIGLIALAGGLIFLAPGRSDGALITGSQLSLNGDGNVGATFLNWDCNTSGGPACPANSETLESPVLPVRLPSTTAPSDLSKILTTRRNP